MILVPNLRARDWGWLSTPRPYRYSPDVEPRQPLHRRLSELRDWCGRVRKFSLPEGFEPRTVQRVDSRCINYAIPTAITLIDLIQYTSTRTHTHTHTHTHIHIYIYIHIYVPCRYIFLFTWERLP
jgi:hypothetical protein